jgi:hypothetical protein
VTSHHPHNLSQAGTPARKNTDKARLSRDRRRDVVENDEYAAFARRIVRAYARRVAAGDIEALGAKVGLAGELDTAIHHAVIGLHGYGYSWTAIALRLGISRQAPRQRWNSTSTGHERT